MLLGRQSELQAIDQALAAARLGRAARLVFRGEPGMGKTALLEHAAAQASGMQVLAARGVEFEADLSFAGLHELLQPALELIEQLPPAHASALRSSLGLAERIEADRLIVGAAVLGVVSAYADKAPVLILIDDAHWMDRASAEAIAFAARRLLADPVAVIISLREDEQSPFLAAGLPEIRLAGLDERATAQLLGQDEAGEASSDLVRRMLRATGGNPLALLELGRAAAPAAASHHDELPIETSVERAYLRRTDGLSERARQVLIVAAAAGVPELGVVRRASQSLGLDEADLEEAEAARGVMVEVGDRLEFVHPLARAAIYHAASPAQRRLAHGALADAMRDPDDVDRRAWHLAAAAAGWDAAAADAMEQVAARARESTGYDAASSALVESARLTEEAALRTSRLLAASDNAWLGGRGDRAVELLAAAKKLAQTAEQSVEIDSLEGHIAMRRGRVDEGYATLVRTASRIEAGDRLRAIRLLADAALSSFGTGFPTARLAAARRAVELLEPGDPPETQVFARVSYGALAIMAGLGADGPDRLREAVPLLGRVPDGSGDPLLLMCEGLTGLFLREARAGRDLLDRALDEARERAPAAALPLVLFMLGRDAAATRRWQIARAQYEEAMRLAREMTQFTWLAGAVAGVAWLDALEGREEECRAHADEGVELSGRYGMGLFKAWSMIAVGLLELGLGRPEPALRHFTDCSDFLASIAIDDPDLSPAPEIVDALVRLGRTPEAAAVLERFEVGANAKGQPFAMARAARARAQVSADDVCVACFEAALAHHVGTPDAFERARTHLYFGERLRRLRRRVDARAQLREALKTFDELGAAPWAERAVAELKATGETARVREDRYRQQLTPQELQVAMTLSEGRTTREAAARLFLSPKTIEYHLRHVYDKLEIRSRDELRAALAPEAPAAGGRKALMFTDLAGSTPLVEAIGDAAWRDLTVWLDAEMRRCFAEHRGREIDHAGDGFFIAFDEARDAIDCAVTVQRRLANHRRRHGYAPRMRIGIHYGDVQVVESSVRGAAVHRAARLCAAAHADGILASREAVEASGRSGFQVQKLELKGIRDLVEATEIRWDA